MLLKVLEGGGGGAMIAVAFAKLHFMRRSQKKKRVREKRGRGSKREERKSVERRASEW